MAAFFAAGCGEATPKVFPTKGVVMYRGAPVEGAVVAFHGEKADAIATGTTDAQGRFTLTTYQPKDGAAPGKHVATVTKIVTTGGASGPMSMEEALRQPQAPVKSVNHLPAKYANPANRPFEFTVTKEGPNEFTLELVD